MKCSNLIICGHLSSAKFIPWAMPLTSLELLQGAVEPHAQGRNKHYTGLLTLCWWQSSLNVEKPNSKHLHPGNFQLFTYLLISEAELEFMYCMVTNS